MKKTTLLLLLFTACINNKAISTESFEQYPLLYKDLRLHISSFLDLATIKNLALSMTKKEGAIRYVRKDRQDILTKMGEQALPMLYQKAGFDYSLAFLQYDHKDWKPSALPPTIKMKLHFCWFLGGMKCVNSDPAKAFYLLYSAACLGHMPAAAEAGALLRNPEYNG
ncbi:MAG: hypothetical protein ACPGXY_06145, partial [Alphaproteobacteria bacterium]